LLEECARVGGAFDFYFKRPGVDASTQTTDEHPTEEPEALPTVSDVERPEAAGGPTATPLNDVAAVGQAGITAADTAREPDSVSTVADADPQEPPFVIERNQDPEAGGDIRQDKDGYWAGKPSPPMVSAAASATSGPEESVVLPVNAEPDEVDLEDDVPLLDGDSILAGDPVEVEEAETMAEIKRLMSEIARTIDDASRAVEQRDAFSMYLRAGQLRIADRYPFLDPFGAEFEYLSGEIAFIGKTTSAQFKEGLTESLRLAVVGLAQSSAQPARLRAHVSEDLDKLLERMRPELERFGLDEAIEQIITF
jgi:hypothetical protein